MCVLDAAGLDESKLFCLRKNYKFIFERGGEDIAIGICKEACTVKVIRTATESN